MSVRWGIIGCGKVVKKKVGPAFSSISGSELVSVMRRDDKKSEESARKLGAKFSYSNINDLLSNSEIDIAYIATPPGLHYEQALACCERGVAVYVEKPFTRNYTEAKYLVDKFSESNVPLFAAHYRRALPKFNKIKSLLENGAIGKILEVDFRLTRIYNDHPWLYNPAISGGGKFFDIAPHTIDLFNYFFGNISVVKSIVKNICPEHSTEDLVAFVFKTENSVIGSANFNLVSNKKSDRFSVYGTEGELHFCVHGNSPIEVINKSGNNSIQIDNPMYIETPMIEEIIKYLFKKESIPCYGRDVLSTVKTIDIILDDLYEGRQREFWKN